jgi:hypothetical protein
MVACEDPNAEREFPLSVYVLETSAAPRSEDDRPARSISVELGRFEVRKEVSPRYFGELLYRSDELVEPSTDGSINIAVPAEFLPSEPYRLWVASSYAVRVGGTVLVERPRSQQLYEYVRVQP